MSKSWPPPGSNYSCEKSKRSTQCLRKNRKNMEVSSERLVRLEQHEMPEFPCTGNREITTVHDVAIQSTPQDLAVAAIYDHMMVDVEEFLLSSNITINHIRESLTEAEIFLNYTPFRYSDFVVLPQEEEEERQRPRTARVSQRSSQVSPPIYLRHRFLPQSRKTSFRRQR